MSRLYLIALVICLAGCAQGGNSPAADAHAPAPPTAKQLKGNEINAALIGRSHQSVTTTGYSFTEMLMEDGTAVITITGNPTQRGKWKVTGDVICVTYPEYGEECNTVSADAQSIWLIDNTKKTTNNKFSRN
ncbi:MAG: hypothetical protein ACOH2R_19905 [Pseudomonas sp.]